jgi:two-component system, cell cycle sensor histidine kinase and response regulator CckA
LPRTYEAETTTPVGLRERQVRGDETILLVEDEEFVRVFVQKVLARHGYTIHAMGDAAQAVAFASAHHGRIDLILTDVVLPDQNGRIMAEQVQALHAESRVLYMSGYTDGTIVHEGVLHPEMAFLQKPFAAGTLARRVRDVLDARVI